MASPRPDWSHRRSPAAWIELSKHALRHALALGAARAATPSIVRSGDISAAISLRRTRWWRNPASRRQCLRNRARPGRLRSSTMNAACAICSSAPVRVVARRAVSFRRRDNARACQSLSLINTGQSAVAAALKLHTGDAANGNKLAVADRSDDGGLQGDEAPPGRRRTPAPHSREAADHSFPFIVAVALIDGRFAAQFDNDH